MDPLDPRHGTNAGYLEHTATDRDYCQPCRDAHATARRQLWRKRYARRVDRLYIDATGTRRRIRALQALGWRFVDIDAACGHVTDRANHTWSHNLVKQERVHVDNARLIADAYETLSMTLATHPLASRTRAMAARKGWPPPLAWDDESIDSPEAHAHVNKGPRRTRADLDPIVVERVLAGDRLPMSQSERREVVMRARELGWSFVQIEERTGVSKPERITGAVA